LERRQLKKRLGSALDKNISGSALDKKLCLEPRLMKAMLDAAAAKKSCLALRQTKVCFEKCKIKSYAWSGEN